jgi:hypothetical protein
VGTNGGRIAKSKSRRSQWLAFKANYWLLYYFVLGLRAEIK